MRTRTLRQVDLHKSAGMLATYTITGKKPAFHVTGVTRQYYIQAVSSSAPGVRSNRHWVQPRPKTLSMPSQCSQHSTRSAAHSIRNTR